MKLSFVQYALLLLDHLLLPFHFLLDRLFIWPLVISKWFGEPSGWPSPWSVSYASLLKSLLSFFHKHYALPDGSHPLTLSEDDFDSHMSRFRSTHLLIPANLAPIGRFISFFPPYTHLLTSLLLSPLFLLSPLRWFVGPIIPSVGTNAEGKTEVDLLIPSCRFLKESRRHYGVEKGNEMCVKLCAISMEHIMRERMSLDVHLLPDLEEGSCIVKATKRPMDEKGNKTRYLDCASLDW